MMLKLKSLAFWNLQSGCCKPSAECRFVYQKPTVWNAPPTGFSSTNPDCKAWNNHNTTLCFDCNSRKAGVIAETKKAWKATAVVDAVLIVILIIVYAIGCHALKNNKEDNAIKLKGFAKYNYYCGFAMFSLCILCHAISSFLQCSCNCHVLVQSSALHAS